MISRFPARNFGIKFLRRFAEFKRRQCQSTRDRKTYLASLSTASVSVAASSNLKYDTKNIFCMEVVCRLLGSFFGIFTALLCVLNHACQSILVFFAILHHFPLASAQMEEEVLPGTHIAASILVATAATAAVAGVIAAANAACGGGGGGAAPVTTDASAAGAASVPDYNSGNLIAAEVSKLIICIYVR